MEHHQFYLAIRDEGFQLINDSASKLIRVHPGSRELPPGDYQLIKEYIHLALYRFKE